MTYEAIILTQVMVFIVVAWRVKSGPEYRKFRDIMTWHGERLSIVMLGFGCGIVQL